MNDSTISHGSPSCYCLECAHRSLQNLHDAVHDAAREKADDALYTLIAYAEELNKNCVDAEGEALRGSVQWCVEHAQDAPAFGYYQAR